MIHETTANNLYEKAKSNGLINTLYSAFGNNINTSIAFSQSSCDAGMDSIEFSARASNALKRSGLLTIGSVIDAIMNDELLRVRNLGRKSYNEIKTKILLYGYKRLTEREKIAFFYYLVSNNTLLSR